MAPSISVIIPTYNRFNFLRHVVESILAQTVPVTEVIVVDDGSTEYEPGMVERYIQDRPAWRDRVRYYYQQNQGLPATLTNGIAKASGDWLAFDGHDDLWLPWKLEWQFRALEKYKDECGLCFTDGWFMNNPYMKTSLFEFAGKQFKEPMGIIHDPVRLMVNRHPLWTQTVVARADLVRQVGSFDPKARYSEDHEFLFRMALVTKFCFVNIPMVLIDRSPSDERHTGESLNWHKEEFRLQMDQYRFEKQQSLSDGLPEDVRRSIRGNLRDIHSAWTNWYLANGEYRKAKEAVTLAAKYELTGAIAAKWILTHISPKLTKRVLSIRDKNAGPRYDQVSWKADETPHSS